MWELWMMLWKLRILYLEKGTVETVAWDTIEWQQIKHEPISIVLPKQWTVVEQGWDGVDWWNWNWVTRRSNPFELTNPTDDTDYLSLQQSLGTRLDHPQNQILPKDFQKSWEVVSSYINWWLVSKDVALSAEYSWKLQSNIDENLRLDWITLDA